MISLDDELKGYPSKSLAVWRANRVDLNVVNENFRYIVHDTSKYKEMMRVIPRFIPTPEILLCKFEGCSFQAIDLESFLKHSSMCHFTWSKLKCAFCPNISSFSSAPVLRDHYEKHSSKEIFICGSCNTFSSCKKLLSEHARLSHVKEDVVILEISRDESSVDPVSNYSLSLLDDRKTISTFTKCIFCDIDLQKQSLEEHFIDHHFFKLYYSCWKCEKVVCRNPYDLDNHFATVHSGISKICLNLKLRFDTNDEELTVKKEIPVRKEEPVLEPAIVVDDDEPVVVPQIQVKEEIIDNEDFIDIEDDEPPPPPTPQTTPTPVQINVVPLNLMLDPRFLSRSN